MALLIISNVAKYCQPVFLAPLLGMDSNSILSEDAKKCQQGILAPLLGMDFISVLGECVKKYQQLPNYGVVFGSPNV